MVVALVAGTDLNDRCACGALGLGLRHALSPIWWDVRRVNARDLRTWCLRQPGAIEDFPFGPEIVSALPKRIREQLGWAPATQPAK